VQGAHGESVPELEGVLKRVKENVLDQPTLAYLQKAQPSTSHEELSKIKQPVLVISVDRDNDNGSAEELAAFIKSQASSSLEITGARVLQKDFPLRSLSFRSEKKSA
jgi:hypothetical protein